LRRALRPVFFLVLAALFVIFVAMPTPEGLTAGGQRAIAIFLLCLVLWITNAVPLGDNEPFRHRARPAS